MSLKGKKEHAESKIQQGLERLNLRGNKLPSTMKKRDLDLAIQNLETAVDTLKKVQDELESEQQ